MLTYRRNAKDFYKTYPEIFHSESGKSQPILSWTHYRILLQVKDEKAREWYEKEALQQAWSVRTLQRNVSSQYYYRMLQTQKKDLVENEMKERLHSVLGLRAKLRLAEPKSIERTTGKAKRIIDLREQD